MATKEGFKLSEAERRRRVFSDDFKIKKVREIEQKIITIAAVSRQYEVTSCNVNRWIKKYRTTYKKAYV